MKESTLKKEFTHRDVQRMRNLITGNVGDRTRVQSGWEEDKQDRVEGEEWEENGKRWTIRNGIKQSITKFDNLKQLAILPLVCPACKKAMKTNELNKKMYTIHRMCFDCVIKMEQDLKVKGMYEEYEKRMMNANKVAIVEDLEKALDTWLNEKDTHVTEQGDIEDWSGSTKKDELYGEAKELLNKVRATEL